MLLDFIQLYVNIIYISNHTGASATALRHSNVDCES